MAEFRAAQQADAPAIEACLVGHSDTSMFLRSNLRAYGPCGGAARNATRMWVSERRGRVTGVVGLSTAGFVLVQLPDGASAQSLGDILNTAEIGGIIGASEQVRATRAALGLTGATAQLDEDEPLYSLDLSRLTIPAGDSVLRQATEADRALMEAWRRAYLVETINFSEDDAHDLAAQDVQGMLDRASLMILETADGVPVAMTSFNAILPDMVQIGNVYTPPDLRGLGHARRSVALHLKRAAANGVLRAILFASGPAASRAYEAIGFGRIGNFTLLFFEEPHRIGAAG